MRVVQFEGRRLAGAVGAMAAGLAAESPADAAVVHQNFNPPNEVSSAQAYSVNLGGDGVNEFDVEWAFFGAFQSIGTKATDFAGTGTPVRPGMAAVIMADNGHAANLALGTLIGPANTFVTPSITRLNGWDNPTDRNPVGNFNGSSGYIGVQFALNGNTHYGYVGFEGDPPDMHTGRVFAIGWEDQPNTGVLAGGIPEPSSLALLAAGVAGLSAYRRRKPA